MLHSLVFSSKREPSSSSPWLQGIGRSRTGLLSLSLFIDIGGEVSIFGVEDSWDLRRRKTMDIFRVGAPRVDIYLCVRTPKTLPQPKKRK